ncbi:hypothetical protein F2P56_007621 [Juglans regia]|uniref:RNase H type-1 domain-containing protein n=2 Tax=Juglans regia TaxID=51240 RepID=A0A833Y268_JUGRE|nr:uncharacterized protein LOC109009062 [Juglans regia]KAF5475859.1 hypothetical protein F2P56_007621 [Juglans regia]
MFLWRACKEALPTLANLRRRKVVEISSCLICKQELETSGYVLWGCIAAKDVWGQGVKKVQKLSFQSDLIFDIWSRLVEMLSLEELEEVAATMRGIWTRRNNTLHGKDFKHPNALHQLAKAELVSYRETLTEELVVKLPAHVGTPKWSKPEVGSYKVNWDVAVNQKEGHIGIGVLIRDHQGFFIGSLQTHRPFKGTPFDAEAYGILLVAVFGITQCLLEGDSKQVVDLMNHHTKNWSLGGCLVEDARVVLNSFACWSVAHTYREANMATHHLAKSALECTEDLYDLETCPSCILPIVTKEMR